MSYSDKFSGVDQIDAEEMIAALLFDYGEQEGKPRLHEEDCAQLGRDILLAVLTRFRPDLLDD